MDKFDIISIVYYCVVMVTSIIGAMGVIVAILGTIKYLKQKKIDALIGFYTQLTWHLKLIKNSVGTSENNILFLFTINSQDLVTLGMKNDYRKNRESFITFLLQKDTQVDINHLYKVVPQKPTLFEKINNLFELMLKYQVSEQIPILFDDRKSANMALETMVALMDNIMNEIENLKGEYKII